MRPSKMDAVRLTKLSSDRKGHDHMIWDGVKKKNPEFTIRGMVVNPPVIGQRFALASLSEWYATSRVESIRDTSYGCVIKTENSTYKIESTP
jgi:hypothetical protein